MIRVLAADPCPRCGCERNGSATHACRARPGALVTWPGCELGPSWGQVVRTDGRPGYVLVAVDGKGDEEGAREWWPVDELVDGEGCS